MASTVKTNNTLQGHYTAMELMNVAMVVVNHGPILEVLTSMISIKMLTLGTFMDHSLDMALML